MSPEYEQSEALRFVIDLAQRAGRAIVKHRPESVETHRKGDDAWGHFVTAADLESNEMILSALRAKYSADEILSEETEAESLTYQGPVWMIDPLDGTKEFKFGGSRFAVMIGRWQNGQPDLGVVYAPAEDILLYAEQGHGAWRQVRDSQPERLHVNDVTKLTDARFVVRKPATPDDVRPKLDAFDRDLPGVEKIPDASIGLKFGRIAAGEAEASINTNRLGSKWDTCAPQAILEEAGGRVTDLFGNPLDYTQPELNWTRSFVASNGVLHPRIVELSRKIETLF